MTILMNQIQVIENRLIVSGPENYNTKARLTDWTKKKRKSGNRLPFRIPAPWKRYRMSCFFVQWCCTWLTDTKEIVGINFFPSTPRLLNALKNTHGVYMDTTKPFLCQKLRLEKTDLPDYQKKFI